MKRMTEICQVNPYICAAVSMLNNGNTVEAVVSELRPLGSHYFFYLVQKLVMFGILSPTTYEFLPDSNKDIAGSGYVINIFPIYANEKFLELEYVDGPWFARFVAFLNIYYRLSFCCQ